MAATPELDEVTPDALLARMRELLSALKNGDAVAQEMAALFGDLDRSLAAGGIPPQQWTVGGELDFSPDEAPVAVDLALVTVERLDGTVEDELVMNLPSYDSEMQQEIPETLFDVVYDDEPPARDTPLIETPEQDEALHQRMTPQLARRSWSERVAAVQAAEAAKQDALARAEANADAQWKKDARRALLIAALNNYELTSDAVWAILDLGTSTTHEGRAMAGVMAAGKAARWIMKTDRQAPSDRGTNNRRPQTVWASLIAVPRCTQLYCQHCHAGTQHPTTVPGRFAAALDAINDWAQVVGGLPADFGDWPISPDLRRAILGDLAA